MVLDSVNKVVYTLDPRYWEDHDAGQLPPPAEMLKGKVRVRTWRKDGGVPFLLFAWLRLRRGWPLEMVRALQVRALGTDTMHVPAWLYYVDATADNWQGARIPYDAQWSRAKTSTHQEALYEAEREREDAFEQRAAESLIESYAKESFWGSE